MNDLRIARVMMSALVLAGCGASADGLESGEVDVGESVGLEEMAIGEETCTTATVDQTVSVDGLLETPATYSKAGCNKAYIVQRDLLRPATGPDDWRYIFAQWKGTATTQAACTAAFLQMDVYIESWGGLSLLSSQAANGVWMSGTCIKPSLNKLPTAFSHYRIVVSGRVDGGSNSATVPVRVGTILF